MLTYSEALSVIAEKAADETHIYEWNGLNIEAGFSQYAYAASLIYNEEYDKVYTEIDRLYTIHLDKLRKNYGR